MAWVANSGSLNSKNVADETYRDPETGRYAKPFPKDVVYFDGASSEGLQYVTKMPKIGDGGRSLTLTWDSYVVDWPLLLQVGVPAHVVAAKALNMTLSRESDSTPEDQPSRGVLRDAEKAKKALISAIEKTTVSKLSAIANVWNDGFNFDSMPKDRSLLVSTGPYTITGMKPGVSVTLSANTRYHGSHHPVIETIVVNVFADPLDQVAALADGSADVIVPRPSSDIAAKLGEVRGAVLQRAPGATYEHLDLQFTQGKHSTFDNMKVREAFLKTIPVQKINSAILGSDLAEKSGRSSQVFGRGAPGYEESVATNGSSEFDNTDVAGAKALLAEAGISQPQVCILFDPSNPKRVTEYQLISEAAALAGFVVTNCSGPDWLNLLGSPGIYDAAIFSWSSSNRSVMGIQSIFGTGARGNFNHYSDPAVDALLSQLAVTPASETQLEPLAQIDSSLYAKAYGLPLYQDSIVIAHNKKFTGMSPATLAKGILWNVWEWAPVVDKAK